MSCESNIYQLAVAGIRGLVPYQPGKPIEELQRELGLKDIVKLASNENPLGPSPKVLSKIQAILPELNRYPDGSGYRLKSVLAEKHQIAAEQITLGNGSNEILELLARTFLTPDAEVLFSEHAFAVYPLVTQAVGATAVVVPAKSYGHDLQAMQQNITDKTRLVFIANPNNPTGTYVPAQELRQFVENLPATVICVIDEAYFEYVRESDYPDSTQCLQNNPNLVITRTFSKAYGLAGLRIGYCFSSPDIADLLNRARQPFNINSIALAAAEQAIQDEAYLQQSVALNNDGMQYLMHQFNDMGLQWIPSVANFISVELRQNAQEVFDALLQKGVIVRPVANYKMPMHLRISIGTMQENEIFIRSLKQVLQNV